MVFKSKPLSFPYLLGLLPCLVLFNMFAGCSTHNRSPLKDYSQQALNVEETLDVEFAGTPSITFRSWNGKLLGTDCDTDIELNSDGTAVLTEYGVAVFAYKGTYTITDKTKLSLVLSNYEGWPTMYLISNGSKLLLVPADNSSEFILGNRGGATIRGSAGSYWPFHQLPAKTDPDHAPQH